MNRRRFKLSEMNLIYQYVQKDNQKEKERKETKEKERNLSSNNKLSFIICAPSKPHEYITLFMNTLLSTLSYHVFSFVLLPLKRLCGYLKPFMMIVAIGYNDNQPIDVVCTILIYNIKSGSFAAELRHMYMSPIYYTQI